MTQAGLVSWAQEVLAAEVSSPLNDVAGAVLELVEASAKGEAGEEKALREALQRARGAEQELLRAVEERNRAGVRREAAEVRSRLDEEWTLNATGRERIMREQRDDRTKRLESAEAKLAIEKREHEEACQSYVKASGERNATEAKLAEVERERDALRSELECDHEWTCVALVDPGRPCNCPWKSGVHRTEQLEADAKALREALGEWVQARKSLREWMHDKSTPRDDAETDRRYARVEAAEKAGCAALARDAGREDA